MRSISKRIAFVCALGTAFVISPASARPLLFTFTGNGITYITTFDSNRTPDFVAPGVGFIVSTLGTVNGLPNLAPLGTTFLSSGHPFGSGFAYDGTSASLFLTGSPVYSGTEASPVFTSGTYTGTLYGVPGVVGSMTISPGAPGPELGGGLLAGLVGLLALAATRLRQRGAALQPAA